MYRLLNPSVSCADSSPWATRGAKGNKKGVSPTLIIYEPETPAIEIIGHAGFGEPGKDILCAACSILMYTLCDALPNLKITSGNGYARLDGSCVGEGGDAPPRETFALIARGYRLLGQNYPDYITYQEKYHHGRRKTAD